MKYLFLLLVSCCCYSQANIAKDTLRLEELVVDKQQRKPKIKSIRYSAICTFVEGLDYNEEVVTLVDKLPPGKLHSVFYKFNNWHYSDSYVTYAYADTSVELVFYGVTENNSPGERIAHEAKIVNVPAGQDGRMEIDLTNLNIYSDGKIFVGLKRLSKDKVAGIKEFEVDGICEDKNNEYTTYARQKGKDAWFRPAIKALKLELQVEVLK